MLAADTTFAPDGNKYLILLTDGGAYMWNKPGNSAASDYYQDPDIAGMAQWYSKFIMAEKTGLEMTYHVPFIVAFRSRSSENALSKQDKEGKAHTRIQKKKAITMKMCK